MTVLRGTRVFLSGGRGTSIFVVSVAAAFFVTGASGRFGAVSDPTTPLQMTAFIAVLFTAIGVWLLVRQWTWGEWLAWAAPLVFTVVVSFVVASGSVLHALYAEALGLDPGDLDVPGIWQVTAAGKLLSFLSLALFVPAAWGIAKHVHASWLRSGEELNIPLYTLVQLMVVGLVAVLAVGSASDAATAVKAAAEGRRAAPPHFGVDPEWTCVRPTVAIKRLNVQGLNSTPGAPICHSGLPVVTWCCGTRTRTRTRTRPSRSRCPRGNCDCSRQRIHARRATGLASSIWPVGHTRWQSCRISEWAPRMAGWLSCTFLGELSSRSTGEARADGRGES
ncbi:hypothetical protein ACFZAV_27980 [Streptomyces sp. NPDC008343]|uniref:hypothetical protein n=1 Tax=Streptomyces sp. NPDC008343 TaxID=3364828 RepID=UPI0036EA298D